MRGFFQRRNSIFSAAKPLRTYAYAGHTGKDVGRQDHKVWLRAPSDNQLTRKGFSGKRWLLMWQARRAFGLRWGTVTLAALSWLALSNHCALGLAMVENHGSEGVLAHDCCASTIPSHPEPSKK